MLQLTKKIFEEYHMTMRISIKEQYIHKFEEFMNSLPKDAIEVKKSLDEEVNQRVDDYRSGKIQTVPFGTGLSSIREKLVSQI
jgi:PHP family Zn ribbon phosphoesterase